MRFDNALISFLTEFNVVENYDTYKPMVQKSLIIYSNIP